MQVEVFVDPQHGPAVRLKCVDATISVWLMGETATVTKPHGQYGLEVSGSWYAFKEALFPVAGYRPVDSGRPSIPPGDE